MNGTAVKNSFFLHTQ